jgi:hypothetical protein
MKIASLLAGVAVVALSATAVSAQSVSTFSRGQYTVGAGIPGGSGVASVTINVPSFLNGNAANIVRANNPNSVASAWHATGASVGNVGGAGERFDNATFSLQGNVSTDCAFYTGTSNVLSFDFGQIGVYVSDNTGAAAAFTMVAPAAMNFDTNLAGCNTANTVSISKNDIRGLVNNSGSGYDTDVFQANLPYIVAASYTAPTTNTVAQGSLQTLTVGAGANAASSGQHGAWKSNMDIEVTIPQADLALLAGQYSGNFTVTIAAL